MKHGLFIVFLALSSIAYSYEINVEIENCPDYYIYLGKHKGPDFEVIDSIKAKNNIITFKGDKKLETGVYFIVIPPQTRFDFLIANEQKFTIKTDSRNVLGKLNSTGEKQYQLFIEVQKEIAEINKNRTQLEIQLDFFKVYQKDTVKHVERLIDSLNNQQFEIYSKYKKELNNEDYLFKILNILGPFEIPDSIENLRYDNPKAHYRYYIDHYLDRIDFNDENLLNTPEFVFHKLIKDYCYYFFDIRANKIEEVYPDIDSLIAKTNNSKKYNQYILSYLISRYENNSDLRLEWYLVYIYRTYFLTNRPNWLSDQAFDIMKLRIESIQYNLIGMTGQDLKLADNNSKNISIYDIESFYKVLFFWEPSCNLCTDALLKLKEQYENLEASNIEVIAICTNLEEKEEWEKFISDNNLTWINAIDEKNSSNFELYYGTYKTPRLFILDNNNKIITKDVKPDYVLSFIKKYEEQQEYERGRFDYMFGDQ